uniref:Uncharacterized protein n=1 Tax=Lactuca sativa TaxID=4236 RepID=A0A9R1UIY4_LACSA|nr:hypothetical protein LSAT_V11C900477500 [Lactuca sativa]
MVAFQSVNELISFVESCSRSRQRFMTIYHSLLWNAWKLRNDRIFNGVFLNPTRGVEEVKLLAFYWHKRKGKNWSSNWEEWLIATFDVA